MIPADANELTSAVLEQFGKTRDPRFRDLLVEAVRHLHQYIRDVHLTEKEFHQICRAVAQLGQMTTSSHNEVILTAGSFGVSSLVCLLNNGGGGEETTANLMGPFWRSDSPSAPNGSSLVRGHQTKGVPLFASIRVVDRKGQPVAGARVDVWHTSSEGYYENEDPEQPEMNLRGAFETDVDGRVWFWSLKPAGYPIPVTGPLGEMLRSQGRHNMRPAHIHFMVHKEGMKTQFSQVYSEDDPNLESDVQFGVTKQLIGHYAYHSEEPAPSSEIKAPWYSLEFEFILDQGDSGLPPAPVSGKNTGDRPARIILAPKS